MPRPASSGRRDRQDALFAAGEDRMPSSVLSTLRRYAGLLVLFVRVSIQNEAAYRLDFFIRLATALANLAGELIALWTIFSNARSLAGWDAWQVIVLLGVYRVMIGIIGTVVAPNMRATMEDVRSGALDFVLVRPVNSQFYASFRQVVVWRGIDALLGLGLVVAGCSATAGRMTAWSMASFVVTLAAGSVIIYSVWLALATTTFWFTRLANVEMVFWNVFEAGRYPVDVYPPWMRWLLTFILPLAFLTTVPAGALTGRYGLTAMAGALVAAPAALAGATAFWRYGLRRYRGASA